MIPVTKLFLKRWKIPDFQRPNKMESVNKSNRRQQTDEDQKAITGRCRKTERKTKKETEG